MDHRRKIEGSGTDHTQNATPTQPRTNNLKRRRSPQGNDRSEMRNRAPEDHRGRTRQDRGEYGDRTDKRPYTEEDNKHSQAVRQAARNNTDKRPPADSEARNVLEKLSQEGTSAWDIDPEDLKAVMKFSDFSSTKETKVPGNDRLYGVSKTKATQYRQYMNRVGGFNRPLSPTRGNQFAKPADTSGVDT